VKARVGLLIAAFLCATAAAVLPAAAQAPNRLPALGVTADWPGWPYKAACGSLTFDPNLVFSEVPEAGLSTSPLDRALRRWAKLVAVNKSRHGWRLARRKRGLAGFVRGQPGTELESGTELEYMEMGKRRGRWGMEAYSQKCWPSTTLDGRFAATWFLAPRQPPLSPKTRTIQVIAGARCTWKEKPPVVIGKPRFEEFDGKLVMTLWLRYRGVSADEYCAAYLPPWPPIKVELPEPLGERGLFDGGEYPPRPAAVYEELTTVGL
jgi:hypothetical protein